MVHLSDQFKIFVVFDERSVIQNVIRFSPVHAQSLMFCFNRITFFRLYAQLPTAEQLTFIGGECT